MEIISSVTNAISLVSRIKKISGNIRDAEFKNLLADLSIELAETKMKMAALIHENAELHEKVTNLEVELQSTKKKSVYVYKYGLNWDEHLNPICPHCGAHLSAPVFVLQRTRPSISGFNCHGCGRFVPISDEQGRPLRFKDARDQMLNSDESNA